MTDRLFGIIVWLLICAGVIGGWNIGNGSALDEAEKAVNNSIENLQRLKQDCEKDLPRDQECTLLYEYVPVNKERSE